MSPELKALFFESLDFFPKDNIAQIEETHRYLSTGKKNAGSNRSRAQASITIDHGIQNALALLPYTLSNSIESHEDVLSNIKFLKELGSLGVLSSDVANKLDYLFFSKPELLDKNKLIHYVEFFELCLDILLERHRETLDNQAIFSLFYFLFFIVKVFNESPGNSDFRKKITKVWESKKYRLFSIQSQSLYLSSQIATIGGYLGDNELLVTILNKEESLLFEIYQMVIFTNFKRRSFEFDRLLTGNILVNKISEADKAIFIKETISWKLINSGIRQ